MLHDNRALALRFATEGWGTNPAWEAVWDELLHPDITQHFCSFPDPIVGLEANKQFNTALFLGFPDIQQSIEQVISEKDKVVFIASLSGTHTGTFMEIPATGTPVQVSESFNLLRFADGKIVEWWYQLNQLAVMQQLGVI